MHFNPFIAQLNLDKLLLAYLRNLEPAGRTLEGFPRLELHFQYDPHTGAIDFSRNRNPQFHQGTFGFVFNYPCHNHSLPKHQLTDIDYGRQQPSPEVVRTLNATALLYRNRNPSYNMSC